MTLKKDLKASKPPAEAPIPTMRGASEIVAGIALTQLSVRPSVDRLQTMRPTSWLFSKTRTQFPFLLA
jgi:hypothetical protein